MEIRKSQNSKVISGVCGGLGEYFNIDPVIVRVIFVVASLVFYLIPVVVYLVLACVMPSYDGKPDTVSDVIKSVKEHISSDEEDYNMYEADDSDDRYDDDRFPKREEGVILINGKPYNPKKFQ